MFSMQPTGLPPDVRMSQQGDGRAFNRALLVMFLGLAGFLTFGLFAQVLHPAWGLWATEVSIFFGFPFALYRLSGKAPLRESTLGKPWLAGIGWGFALGAVNFFAMAVPLMWLSRQLLPQQVLDAFDASKMFENQRPGDLVFLFLGVCLAAPLCEEFFFRGAVQRGLMERLPPARAIVLTGFIFSAFHLDPVGLLARFELGVLFGLIAWRSGSLWPSIAAHFANNFVSTVSYFATKDSPEEPLVWWVPLSMAMAGTLGLIALVRLARVRPGVVTPPPVEPKLDPPAAGVGEAFFPWALAALLSFGALALIDYRGIATNAVEVMNPVALPGQTQPSPLDEDQLKEWRRQARAGELTPEAYAKERRKMAAEIKQRGPPVGNGGEHP
jgi:uncharacterized protein